jgi:phenylalanyl-tRNA synthetase alpha chain
MQAIGKSALRRALSIRDLTDSEEGPHAMQLVLAAVVAALERTWGCDVRLVRASPVASASDNYDRLGYPQDAVTRDARYTRWIGDGVLLRTQTSAMVPPALRKLASESTAPTDVLLVCPGIVYRRDQIDRLHTGEPHQLDLWRIRRGPRLGAEDLETMITAVVAALLPGWRSRALPAVHPYTTDGRQIDVARGGDPSWIEIGECGLAAREVVEKAGLSTDHSGLAMGLGLDRLLMMKKGIDDIRLLRSEDPRVVSQMVDLAPYRAVSAMPPVRRDLSLAMWPPIDAELVGDRVRAALGDEAELLEEVAVLADTAGAELAAVAAERLGLGAGQHNVLVRITLRALDRTLTSEACNELRDRVYAALHEGTVYTWAADRPPRP